MHELSNSGNYGASGMKAFLSMSSAAAAELTVPQHVNIHTNPVFNTTVLAPKLLFVSLRVRTVRGLQPAAQK